ELFDDKPKLAEMNGTPMPESFTKGQPIAQLQGRPLKCFGPQHPFQRWGRSGQEISTLLPHIGSIADEICVVRSMQTEQINHDPAGVSRPQQRDVIDAVAALTKSQPDGVDDPEVAARLSQYEMAFRMQTSIPALTDFSSEPKHVLESYGVEGMDGSFGANCLL